MHWVLLFLGVIAAIDLPVLLRQRRWGDLAAFAAVWCAALALGLLQASSLPLPSVAEVITAAARQALRSGAAVLR